MDDAMRISQQLDVERVHNTKKYALIRKRFQDLEARVDGRFAQVLGQFAEISKRLALLERKKK